MTRNTMTLDAIPSRERELLEMLTYRRPSGSRMEQAFISKYLLPLGCEPDEYGNHWLTVGQDSPILWSCHTDTVHRHAGFQRVLYGADVASTDGKGKECLGADCTVGVWIMANMIKAGIPGTYVFHCDEEIGGLGSRYIAGETNTRLAGLQFAIAFDRKGYDEIITHQMGDRCASDAFAASLATTLAPLDYCRSDGGTFTDTANYSGIVPECTNISVGYHGQHTNAETQDIAFASTLLDRLISADWTQLVCSRDPNDANVMDDNDYHAWWKDDDTETASLAEFISRNPQTVAAFLLDAGYTENDLDDFAFCRNRLGDTEESMESYDVS